MTRTALAACLFLIAGAAHATPYYLQSSARACATAETLMKPDARCVALRSGEAVAWDGKIIDGFGARYLGGNVARVTARGQNVFVYANYLGSAPPSDPLRRAFTLARDAIGCADAARLSDALEARAERDERWFGETGCIVIPRGARSSRLWPKVDDGGPIWQMRVQIPHNPPQALWVEASDFR